MTPYAVIAVLMFVGRVAYFRQDRACMIGLRKYSSLSLLTYDLYINVFLTGMFLWPLLGSRLTNPRIRRMAQRTLVAAVAALTTSTVNIAVLTIMHGQQLSWVCLGSCGTDVTLNAVALFWVTSYGTSSAPVAPSKDNHEVENSIGENHHGSAGGSAPGPAELVPPINEPPMAFVAQYSNLMRGIMPDFFGAGRISNVNRRGLDLESTIPTED
ncbi:transmembrane protein [Ceratobasidium sp. AG-Ba]|nr:transmembrane protein [Ceratobasidium sp. AG-Ba]QRW11179.1 transmembrane protein [Ceratobasidium sp. AG-Ba]